MKKLFGGILLGVLFSLPAWAALDLNKATFSELESVKGIGPVKAKAIVAYREKNGTFKSIDDLGNVKGIGKGTLDKLKSELTVEAVAKKK